MTEGRAHPFCQPRLYRQPVGVAPSGKLPMYKRIAAAGLLSLGIAASAQTPPAGGPPDKASGVPAWLYSVRPGDTLISLGQRHLIDPQRWDVVQKLNRIADPHRIPPGTVLRIPASLLRSSPGQATLKTVHGGVRWREPDGAWKTAATGQALPVGAELRTEALASATLELANGTQLRVHPGSTLVLDTLSLYAGGLMADTRVRLLQGQTEITDNPGRRTQQNLRVLTPSAQAVVRGTVFRVGVEDGQTREETLEGSVGVDATGKTVVVGPGFGTLARAGEAPVPPRALPRAPDVSALPSRLEQLPLRFSLPPARGEQGAVLWGQVSQDSNFDAILAEKTSAPGSGVLSIADLPNGRYILRVRALDALGLQGLEARHNFTVAARPFAPALQAPGRSATVRSPRPDLRWTNAVDAARYRVQASQSENFARLLLDQPTAQTEWLPAGDLPEGKLYWRVASITAQGEQGPWSAASPFTYKPAPGQPDLGKAALRYETDALLLELPPPPPDHHYRVSVSATAGMAPEDQQQDSSDGAVRLPRPSGGTHYLGVRLVDNQDGTAGPPMLQKIDVPSRHPYLWMLGLPLLLL